MRIFFKFVQPTYDLWINNLSCMVGFPSCTYLALYLRYIIGIIAQHVFLFEATPFSADSTLNQYQWVEVDHTLYIPSMFQNQIEYDGRKEHHVHSLPSVSSCWQSDGSRWDDRYCREYHSQEQEQRQQQQEQREQQSSVNLLLLTLVHNFCWCSKDKISHVQIYWWFDLEHLIQSGQIQFLERKE